MPPEPARRDRIIFRRVYSGPGYPLDPKNKTSRQFEQAMNLQAQPLGVVDLRPLRHWLWKSVN